MDNDEIKSKKRDKIITIVTVLFVALIFVWREYLRFEFIKPELVISYDENFEMQLTKGWETVSKGKLNEEADIEIKNSKKDLYLIVLIEDISDSDATFQDYVDVVVQGVESGYDVTIPEVKTDGVNRYFDFEFKQNLTNIYMCMYVIKTENYVGQVAIWSTKENKDKVTQEIENGIIETIKER